MTREKRELTHLDWREDHSRIGPLWLFDLGAPSAPVTRKVQRIWASTLDAKGTGKSARDLYLLMCDSLSEAELRELAWVRFLMIAGWSEQELLALWKDHLEYSSSEAADTTANWISQA